MTEQKPNKSSYPTAEAVLIDAMLEPERKLWGLSLIADCLGVSVDKARTLAANPDVPIYRPPGSSAYFAFKSELMAWLRGKSFMKTHENP